MLEVPTIVVKSSSDLDRDSEVEVKGEHWRNVMAANNYQAAKKPSGRKKMAKEK